MTVSLSRHYVSAPETTRSALSWESLQRTEVKPHAEPRWGAESPLNIVHQNVSEVRVHQGFSVHTSVMLSLRRIAQ